MKWMISDGNILIEPSNASPNDYHYLSIIKPYQLGKSSKYKVPLTKLSLTTFINMFNIDLGNIQGIYQLLFDLDLALNLNLLDDTIKNTEYLRGYQIQGIHWMKLRLQSAKAVGLFWAPRTGKTRTTCSAIKDYNKIIVLSLAGQEAHWESTFKETRSTYIYNIHKQSPTKRKILYQNFNNCSNGILIGSINTITNDILSGAFQLDKADMLVVDEIHKAKNPKTKLYKGVKALRSKSNYCIGLTGTPVSKHTNEILPLFALLYPTRFSKTYLANYFFQRENTKFSRYGLIGDLIESKKKEWLEFMGLYFSQVSKEQALPWAKEPLLETIKLSMDPQQRKIYEQCLIHNEIQVSKNKTLQIQEVIAQFTRLRQLQTHPLLLNIKIPSVKEQWVLGFLENKLKESDGIIIFSTHTSYLKMLYQILLSLNYKVCLITGEVHNKTQIANEFQAGKYDIVLANIQAGSKGITLDRADTMIFLDQDWRPDENQQAVERFTATTAQAQKLRVVYKLEIADTFEYEQQMIHSMDYYMRQVIEGKIKQTDLINNFKEIFRRNYG